jgi:YVTN family beta-propeller protein
VSTREGQALLRLYYTVPFNRTEHSTDFGTAGHAAMPGCLLENPAYVANRGSATISVIDVASSTQTATGAVGNAPIDVRVNPAAPRL